jgi:hypothetical protein
MLPLHHDLPVIFRFVDERIIHRIHLEAVEAGRQVAIYTINTDRGDADGGGLGGVDAGDGERLGLLATADVGEGGWVDLPQPLPVRAGNAIVAVPAPPAPAAPVHKSAPPPLTLCEVVGRFAVCKLPPLAEVPGWAMAGDVFSVTRTGDELSVMCRQELVPAGTQAEVGWRCVRVAGTMPFTLVGVLASLSAAVAAAGVGLFAISTFDTDYLLVKEADFATAIDALRAAGHRVERAEA